MKPIVKWQEPNTIPTVEKDSEKLFWLAIKNHKGDKYVFLANYQNRPLEYDEEGEVINDCLVNPDGEPIESIGWVSQYSHYEFDDFYVPISFHEEYVLLGWAEYRPPEPPKT